jgi:integrase
MKAGREHRVPLSDAAMALLESLPKFEGTDLVFPSPRGKGSLSDMTLTAVMRRMGRTEVPHGFRSTFRDWAGECTHYPGDMAEMALAHVISSSVEAAYRRRDMLEKRRQMMNDWAEYCLAKSSVSAGGEHTNLVHA